MIMQDKPNSVNGNRLFYRNKFEIHKNGRYVLYWMQIARRFSHNHAIDLAVEYANKLNIPLLICEPLRVDYPWACDRFHKFILEGMKEHSEQAAKKRIHYYPYSEKKSGAGKGLIQALAKDAALVISDEFPVYIIPRHNYSVGKDLQVPFITVDSNGILPLQLSDKAPYSAYIYRQLLQKKFIEAYSDAPQADSLKNLKQKNNNGIDGLAALIQAATLKKFKPAGEEVFSNLNRFISGLSMNHSIKTLDHLPGTTANARKLLKRFAEHKLTKYDELRNHPDQPYTSNLSPYLHFGKISIFEITDRCFAKFDSNWNYKELVGNRGSKGYFTDGTETGKNIDGFLDEAITWRETGYHYCFHEKKYDKFESLPDWALRTLKEHAKDKREAVYSLEQFDEAATHNEIWNAAQRELKQTGKIHNYLRMLWGKKILEWTKSPELALEIMIGLNNKYSIDGRNPNSYSGIFWVLGRFDRPWQERPVFGKIRYMSTEQARKKVKMDEYLKKYGDSPSLF